MVSGDVQQQDGHSGEGDSEDEGLWLDILCFVCKLPL